MAATGNEVPLLSQLLLLKNWIVDKLDNLLPVKTAGTKIVDFKNLDVLVDIGAAGNSGALIFKNTYADGDIKIGMYNQADSPAIYINGEDDNADSRRLIISSDSIHFNNLASNLKSASIGTDGSGNMMLFSYNDDPQYASTTRHGLVKVDGNTITSNENGVLSIAAGLLPSVDIVKVTEHSTSYTKDTLEIVCDSTGKVTAMYFVSV